MNPFTTSKWTSEFQFCEIYLCRWLEMVAKWQFVSISTYILDTLYHFLGWRKLHWWRRRTKRWWRSLDYSRNNQDLSAPIFWVVWRSVIIFLILFLINGVYCSRKKLKNTKICNLDLKNLQSKNVYKMDKLSNHFDKE